MDNKSGNIIAKLFRIIAIPFSILWFLRSISLIISDYNVNNWFWIVLSLVLPILLFKAAISQGNPLRNENFEKLLWCVGSLLVIGGYYIALSYLIMKLLSPYIGESLAGILFFIVFIASLIFFIDYFPGIIKRRFQIDK
jgi:hypothetical protein